MGDSHFSCYRYHAFCREFHPFYIYVLKDIQKRLSMGKAGFANSLTFCFSLSCRTKLNLLAPFFHAPRPEISTIVPTTRLTDAQVLVLHSWVGHVSSDLRGACLCI